MSKRSPNRKEGYPVVTSDQTETANNPVVSEATARDDMADTITQELPVIKSADIIPDYDQPATPVGTHSPSELEQGIDDTGESPPTI